MIKFINYFFQTILIYFFFIIGRILGLNLSRKIFASLFSIVGPLVKSQSTIKDNLNIFSHNLQDKDKKDIIIDMWRNYGMTFIEYIFLNYFRKNNSHIKIKGEENFTDLIKEKKTCIFISGHFANFELMSMEITKKYSFSNNL